MEALVMSLNRYNRLQFVMPAVSALALLLVGCSDGTSGTTTGSSSSGGNASCDPPADVASVGPLVAVSTITFSPDLSMRTDTIQFSDKLAVDGKVEAGRTIELAGTNSTLWASKNKGEMFLAEADTGSVIKYGLAADGSIEEKGKIGFSAYGVTSFYWTLIATDTSKHAFLFDEKTLQGFIWNPDCMTITSNVDLKDKFNTMEGGKAYTVWREIQTIEVGGKFFASFHYFDPATAAILPRSGMLVMDPADDSFTVVEIPDCAGLHNSVLGSDGKIYSGSGVIAAGANFLGVPGAMCLARFDPATMTWDATYKPDVPALVDGMAVQFVGGLFKNASAPNAPAYVRVLLKDLVPGTIKSPLNVAAAPLWKTYKLDDLTNPMAATDTMVAPAGGIIYPIEMDGKTYVSDAAIQQGKSWMIDLSTDPPTKALELSGWGYYAVKFH
jgi:hypothetical protein